MGIVVGKGSHHVEFEHPEVGLLTVRTGLDRVAWGYGLNVAQWPTYGGEVIQILSCYIDDLEVAGTLQTQRDVEALYTYFFQYMSVATQGDPRRGQTPGVTKFNQEPMVFRYPHRGWTIDIMPKAAPGFRKARDVVAPEWRIQCHVVDDSGDVDEIKDMIIDEAMIKSAVQSNDPAFDEHFGLTGQIKFIDENPFSDPKTSHGSSFSQDGNPIWKEAGDAYAKLLPAYLKGDFDAITGGLGSYPAFGRGGPESTEDSDQTTKDQADKVLHAKKKK